MLLMGKSCSNSNGEVETKTCNIQPCPVNCEGDWGEWSKKNVVKLVVVEN